MIHLLKYAKENRSYIIVGSLSKLLEAVFELFLPILLARLIDNGVNQNDSAYIYRMGGLMLILSIVGFGFAMVCQYSSSIASQGFGTELRNVLMKKINTFSHKEIDDFGASTLITRATNDVNQLQLALAMLIRLVIRAPFLSIGSVIMAVYINPRLSLIFAVLLPLFAAVLGLIMWLTVPMYKKVQVKIDRLAQIVGENLSGVRVIRAFARSRYEEKRSTMISNDLSKANIRVNNLSALMTPATSLIMNIGIMVILYVGANQVDSGMVFQGEVLALINYITQMLLALIVVANLVVIFTKSAASAARINEVLDVKVSVTGPSAPLSFSAADLKEPNTAVEFKKVSFQYDKDSGNALEKISFELPKGTVLGITGATGSGKSTLINLIPRFYDRTAGVVSVYGTDVAAFDLKQLRSRIGFVPQRNSLFKGTVAENMRWGKENATDEEIWHALEIAQIADFVGQLKEGLQAPVYESGKNFSGGQRQRLTIARALVGDPEVVILDDSLSALDYETDARLRSALKKLSNTTVIIVSQRLSSIQTADNILVMNEGKLEAQGIHDKLMIHSKTYQDIYRSQNDPSIEEEEE